jgi:uncharacterized protein
MDRGFTTGTGRIVTLDGLRGIAVMGILLMNIIGFALPEGAYFNPLAYGGERAIDRTLWGVNFVLSDGKMRNLFSLLFGASLLLIVERTRAAGGDAARVHFARMATLLLFGLAHLYLLWWGDILTHYALVGCIAFLFVDRPTEALVRMGVALFVAQLAMSAFMLGGLQQMQAAAAAPGATKATVEAWLATRSEIGVPTADRLAATLALYRGPWSGIVHHALVDQGTSPLLLLLVDGFETLGLMLLGMAGLRSGFLTGAWSRGAYVRVMRWGYGIGLTGELALLGVAIFSGYDSLTVFGASITGGTPFRPLVMAGHAALAILWLTGGSGGLRPRVVAAGRMAFSNYLGTSLVMTALFYGWGFGLYGIVSRAGLYLIVPVVWAVMLLWSPWWLARFRYGPLEWVWRSLARGRVQAMRRV